VLVQLADGRVRYGAGLGRHLGTAVLAVVPERRALSRLKRRDTRKLAT
jgi:hypothetical protein